MHHSVLCISLPWTTWNFTFYGRQEHKNKFWIQSFTIPQKLETVRILFINPVAPRNARPQGFFNLGRGSRKRGHSPLVTAGWIKYSFGALSLKQGNKFSMAAQKGLYRIFQAGFPLVLMHGSVEGGRGMGWVLFSPLLIQLSRRTLVKTFAIFSYRLGVKCRKNHQFN